jgi:hypothetical protein
VRRLRKRPRKSAVAFADQALTPSQSKRKTAPHTKATKGSAFFDSIDPQRTFNQASSVFEGFRVADVLGVLSVFRPSVLKFDP